MKFPFTTLYLCYVVAPVGCCLLIYFASRTVRWLHSPGRWEDDFSRLVVPILVWAFFLGSTVLSTYVLESAFQIAPTLPIRVYVGRR